MRTAFAWRAGAYAESEEAQAEALLALVVDGHARRPIPLLDGMPRRTRRDVGLRDPLPIPHLLLHPRHAQPPRDQSLADAEVRRERGGSANAPPRM